MAASRSCAQSSNGTKNQAYRQPMKMAPANAPTLDPQPPPRGPHPLAVTGSRRSAGFPDRAWPEHEWRAEEFIQTALAEWRPNCSLDRYNWRRFHASLKSNALISRLGLTFDKLLRSRNPS
jgi:hypothetical protein